MTIHNALKARTGLLTSFGDLCGLGDEEEGTVRLGESLTPIIDVWRQPEAALLRDETLFAGALIVASVALELSFFGIRNHTGSGKLMVVDRMTIGSTAALSSVAFTVALELATDVDTTTAVRPRDTRWLNTPGFNLISGTGAAIVGDVFWRAVHGANQTIEMREPFVLHPGRELRAYADTAALAIVGAVSGRVRQFAPREDVNR